jgi:hypothetical protein
MTEAEWLACTDPHKMLEHVSGWASDRKLRLFAVGCCRLLWKSFPGESRMRQVVFVSERYADGLATREELKAARKNARHCEVATARPGAYQAAVETASATTYEARLRAIDDQGFDPVLTGQRTDTPAANRLARQQSAAQCALLRDIFGDPFQPPRLIDRVQLAWDEGTVVKLAHAIYEDHAFDQLSILADALEDAGCTDAEVLSHLRAPGPHVRGCWALDLLLGKA